MSLPKIRIKTDGILATIEINGKELEGVRHMSFEMEGGKNRLPVLKLDLIATDMEIDTACIPELPEVFEEFYELKK